MSEPLIATRAQTGRIYDLGPATDIPEGEGRSFVVDGLVVAVFRTRSGEVFATQPDCPHRGGPLADGLVGAGQLICPLHSYKFDLATGRALGAECASLKTYPAVINGVGHILLRLSATRAVEEDSGR